MCFMSCANNKGADQLASVAVQAGLCLAWSETPEDMFCHVAAQLYCMYGNVSMENGTTLVPLAWYFHLLLRYHFPHTHTLCHGPQLE